MRALEQADQLLRDELAAGATDAAVEETLTEEQPTAAGTEDTTESLIAEVQNNAPAAEEAASASGHPAIPARKIRSSRCSIPMMAEALSWVP